MLLKLGRGSLPIAACIKRTHVLGVKDVGIRVLEIGEDVTVSHAK